MFPLVLGEISEVSLNTLTADGKYFVQDCENLPLKIQMYFLFHFWNPDQIFLCIKRFEKNGDRHS